jgi:ornithine cyclodeaminase/alanine dehydrogenase-like protein (mu-crystallin family)
MVVKRSAIYLSRADIEALNIPMRRIIDVVEDALIEKAHGRVQMPSKHWLQRDSSRWFGGMSSLVPKIGYAAMKWQSGATENAVRGLPYITGMLFLNNVEDGLIAAIMDSTWITQQRTAASSAIAVKYLGNTTAKSYAMLGTGVQGRSHFEAFQHVLPELEEVVIYDINPKTASMFADVVEKAGYRAIVVNSARAAVEASNIVVTSGPIEPNANRMIDADWLHAGLTSVTIDYDCYWKRDALHAADRILTDDKGQIRDAREHGYFIGSPEPEAEIGEVAAGLKLARLNDQQKIVVLNMGVAVEDVATAKEIYELAKESNIGMELPY